jgi:hypothetical protein
LQTQGSKQATELIRVKVLGQTSARSWMHQFPGNVPKWDGCEFIFDRDCRNYDWLVVYNEIPSPTGERKGLRYEELSCPPEHTMLTTTEPSSIKIYGRAYTDQFGCVLTSQEEWALPHRDRIFSQPALHWFYGIGANQEIAFDQMVANPPINKTRQLSMVYSSKKQWHTLHRKRFNFMQGMIEAFPDIDLYGRGATPLNDKAEALDAYKYHISIENFIGEHHWTEKLADPFLGLTLPFYCGCPNAADYFPTDSFIPIDINKPDEAVRIITRAIQNNEYERRLPSILKARRLVLYEYNFFAVVAREIRKRHDPHRSPTMGKILYSRHTLRNRNLGTMLNDVYEKARTRTIHVFKQYLR